MPRALLSVPAGRCIRRSPEEKWVDPQPDKGLLEMLVEDDLMHLWWKTRDGSNREDELIIFPGEATFEVVSQDPTGRTHVLKFSSSDQKYFFWLQRADQTTYESSRADINSLLQDPSHQYALPDMTGQSPYSRPQASNRPGYVAPPRQAPATEASSGASATAVTSTPAATAPPAAGPSTTSAEASEASSSAPGVGGTEDIARMLVEWARARELGGSVQEDARLTDVLSPANLSQLLSSKPELLSTITPLLPEAAVPANPTPENILPIVSNPVFTEAIASLDNALRSGGLPESMMRDIGLPAEAGRGPKEFLEALRALGEQGGASGGPTSGGDDSMETD